MKKIIKLGFIDKKLERRAPFPLVASDKNSYLLELDISKYPDAKKVFMYAKRADGEIVCDNVNISESKACYILKQGIYAVPGELLIRFVLRDKEDTILTAAELCCEVHAGIYDGIPAEDINTVEECIIKLSEMSEDLALKADKEYVDAATERIESEVDKKADKEYLDAEIHEVTDAVTMAANAVKKTANGAPVCIDDLSPISHTVNVKLKSKNLIPYPFASKSAVSNEVSFTVNDDQTITVNGTPTVNTSFSIASGNMIPVVKGKEYTISYNNVFTGNEYFYISHYSNGMLIDSLQVKKSETKTFVAKSDGALSIGLVVYGGTTYNNVNVAVQLEEGDTATEITPYTVPSTASLTVWGADETDGLQTFAPLEDATYKIAALSPVMNLNTDTDGVIIEVEYNQDVNAFKDDIENTIAQLRQAIIELGGTV